MALVKTTLQSQLYRGLLDVFTNRLNDTDESGDPQQIIDRIANDIATCVADSVDSYLKSGDITVGPSNISVTCTASGSPGIVVPLVPAKMQ